MALFEHWDVRDGLEAFTDLLRWCLDRQPATAAALVRLAGVELARGDRRVRAALGRWGRSHIQLSYDLGADTGLCTIDVRPYRSAPQLTLFDASTPEETEPRLVVAPVEAPQPQHSAFLETALVHTYFERPYRDLIGEARDTLLAPRAEVSKSIDDPIFTEFLYFVGARVHQDLNVGLGPIARGLEADPAARYLGFEVRRDDVAVAWCGFCEPPADEDDWVFILLPDPDDPSWGLNIDVPSSGLRVTDAAWDVVGYLACEDHVPVRTGPGCDLWERAARVRREQSALRDV